jgi:superfamily I DNA/RNA helicase
VTKTKEALVAAGIPVIALDRYDGRPVDAVKVGTVKRAKGLEFKQVLLARVEPALLAPGPGPASETDRERRNLDRRGLYVAMTRARDGLWVGVRSLTIPHAGTHGTASW